MKDDDETPILPQLPAFLTPPPVQPPSHSMELLKEVSDVVGRNIVKPTNYDDHVKEILGDHRLDLKVAKIAIARHRISRIPKSIELLDAVTDRLMDPLYLASLPPAEAIKILTAMQSLINKDIELVDVVAKDESTLPPEHTTINQINIFTDGASGTVAEKKKAESEARDRVRKAVNLLLKAYSKSEQNDTIPRGSQVIELHDTTGSTVDVTDNDGDGARRS